MAVITDVTRRRMYLGIRDSVTGWCAKNFVDTTIEMIIVPRGATEILSTVGTYARRDAVGVTMDAVEIGDKIFTESKVYCDVLAVQEHWLGDSFMYRACQLSMMPLHEV